MPSTINGIGTTYYGSSEVRRCRTTCPHCNARAEMTSYTTRLWVVVFFVPIIPLGKKRIIQQCAVCSQHYVLPYREWDKRRTEAEVENADIIRNSSSDPAKLKQAIGNAIGFEEEEWLADVGNLIEKRQINDPDLLVILADARSSFNDLEGAERALRRSYELDPAEIVGLRLAFNLITQNRPDEAEPLLQPVLDLQIEDEQGLLLFLAESYQSHGKHEKSLAVLDKMAAAFPQAEKDREFMRLYKLAEKNVGTAKVIKRKMIDEHGQTGYQTNWWTAGRRLTLVVSLMLVGLICYGAYSLHLANKCTVYVVNGTTHGYAATVAGKRLNLVAGGRSTIEIPEGTVEVTHTLFANAPPKKIEISRSFLARPFQSSTVFVINPDELAHVYEVKIPYSVGANNNEEPTPTLHRPGILHRVDGVDDPFRTPPQTLKMKKSSGTVYRKVVDQVPPQPGLLVNLGLLAKEMPGEFGKAELLADSPVVNFLKNYALSDPYEMTSLGYMRVLLPKPLFRSLMQEQLPTYPMRVNWHRAYQSVMEDDEPEKDLIPDYKKLLTEHPNDSDCLYLMARLVDDDAESEKLLRQAIKQKPDHRFARTALSGTLLWRGDFAGAKAILDPIKDTQAEEIEVRYDDVLFATRNYQQLIDRTMMANRLDTPLRRREIAVSAAFLKDGRPRASSVLSQFDQNEKKRDDQMRKEDQQNARARLAYLAGDNKEYLKLIEGLPSEKLEAQLARREFDQALADLRANKVAPPFDFWQLALEALAVKDPKADAVADQALMELTKRGSKASRKAALVALNKEPFDAKLLIESASLFDLKPMALTVLGLKHSAHQATCFATARKLNFHPRPPAQTIQKIVGKSRP